MLSHANTLVKQTNKVIGRELAGLQPAQSQHGKLKQSNRGQLAQTTIHSSHQAIVAQNANKIFPCSAFDSIAREGTGSKANFKKI